MAAAPGCETRTSIARANPLTDATAVASASAGPGRTLSVSARCVSRTRMLRSLPQTPGLEALTAQTGADPDAAGARSWTIANATAGEATRTTQHLRPPFSKN